MVYTSYCKSMSKCIAHAPAIPACALPLNMILLAKGALERSSYIPK